MLDQSRKRNQFFVRAINFILRTKKKKRTYYEYAQISFSWQHMIIFLILNINSFFSISLSLSLNSCIHKQCFDQVAVYFFNILKTIICACILCSFVCLLFFLMNECRENTWSSASNIQLCNFYLFLHGVASSFFLTYSGVVEWR